MQPEIAQYNFTYNSSSTFNISKIVYGKLSDSLYTFQNIQSPSLKLTMSKFNSSDQIHIWTKSYDINTGEKGYGITGNEAYLFALQNPSSGFTHL